MCTPIAAAAVAARPARSTAICWLAVLLICRKAATSQKDGMVLCYIICIEHGMACYIEMLSSSMPNVHGVVCRQFEMD
jgi:hypothetical protein